MLTRSCVEVVLPKMVVVLLLVCLGCLLVIWFYVFRVPSDNGDFPPGPPAYPFVGNLPDMVNHPNPSELFRDLAKIYGPVISLKLPGGLLVAINDHQSMQDALVRHGDQFNHRSTDMVLQLVGDKGILGSQGDTWKDHRRFLAKIFRENGVGKAGTEEKVAFETRGVIEYLKEQEGSPTNIHERLAQATFNIVNWVITGEETCSDPRLFHNLLDCTDKAFILPFASSFNYLPWIAILITHGRQFLQAARHFKRLERATRDLIRNVSRRNNHRSLENLGENLSATNKNRQLNSNSVVEGYYQEQRKNPNHPRLSGKEIEYVARDLFSAGMETSLYTTQWALIALACSKEIQENVYNELVACEAATGRSLSYKDRSQLRYTEAVVQEALRWSRVVPLIAHGADISPATRQQYGSCVELNGFRIPPKTPVYFNLYAISRDEKSWERPNEFYPEHFYDPGTGQLRNLDKNVAFSVGKRSCLGEALARQELFYFLTSLILNFEIKCPEPIKPATIQGRLGMTYRPPCINLIYQPRKKAETEGN